MQASPITQLTPDAGNNRPPAERNELGLPAANVPRVVIVGGGFAGVQLARGLRREKVQVVLLDKNNYHTFQPLLYQVATAELDAESIADPLRKLFANQANFYLRVAVVHRVDAERKCLRTSLGSLQYDYLVLALGSEENYFGNRRIEQFALPMKEVSQAIRLRNHLLSCMEQALLAGSEAEKHAWMNIVIAGGGPTGVEIAGALGELKKNVFRKDYPELDFSRMEIHLVEGSPRLLATMANFSGRKAEKYLAALGVQVHKALLVKDYDGQTVSLSDGTSLPGRTLIWTAGVKANGIEGLPTDSYAGANRLKVDAFHRVAGCRDLFAAGDVSAMTSAEYPKGHPQLGSVAKQQGRHLAATLRRTLRQEPLMPFRYRNLGTMATVGRNRAVVELPGFRFGGVLAWFVWMLVHLVLMLGFRNRVVIMVDWLWNYFTLDRGSRLMVCADRRAAGNGSPPGESPMPGTDEGHPAGVGEKLIAQVVLQDGTVVPASVPAPTLPVTL